MRLGRLLILILLMGAPLSLYGAQPATTLEFAGFTHNALGDATLEVVEDRLVISNIGEGGFDGIAVELGGVSEFSAEWANFNSSNIPVFASMQFGARANLADENGTSFYSFLILQGLYVERERLNILEISPNFTQTTSGEFRYVVYDRGEEVISATSEVGRVFARELSNAAMPFPTGVRALSDEEGRVGYAISWHNLNNNVQIIFPFRDNAMFFADELQIFPVGENTPVDLLTELNLWIADIPELTILSEESVN